MADPVLMVPGAPSLRGFRKDRITTGSQLPTFVTRSGSQKAASTLATVVGMTPHALRRQRGIAHPAFSFEALKLVFKAFDRHKRPDPPQSPNPPTISPNSPSARSRSSHWWRW